MTKSGCSGSESIPERSFKMAKWNEKALLRQFFEQAHEIFIEHADEPGPKTDIEQQIDDLWIWVNDNLRRLGKENRYDEGSPD